jgi:DNA-binding CsgD family transcriptional regulator
MNSALSERELQILLLVAQGLSNRQIAGQLDISDNTVKVHVRNIFAKINVASRTEASLYAVRHGMLVVENQPVAPAPIVEPPPLLMVPANPVRLVPVPRWRWLLAAGMVVVIGGGGLAWWTTQTPVVPVIRQQSSAPTRWARLPALPNPQPEQQLVVYVGQLYAFTGNHSAQWLQFDGATRTWIVLADLPFVVPTGAKTWADGAGLWVVGSDDGRGVWRWDGQKWQVQPAIPATLEFAAVVRVDGALLVLGQISATAGLSAWTLSPQSQSWQPGVDFAHAVADVQLVVLEGVVYLFGDGAHVWRLDGQTERWVPDRDLPFGWSRGAVTTVLGSILVIDATTPALWAYVPGQGVVSKQIVPTQIALGRQVVTWQAQLIMPNLDGTVINAYQAVYQTFVPVMP